MNWILALSLAFSGFVITAIGMIPLMRLLKKRSILDQPNERSSHTIAIPKGGGLCLIPVILAMWILDSLIQSVSLTQTLLIAGVGLTLCLISWIDDLKHLSPSLRLFTHIVGATIVFAIPTANALIDPNLISISIYNIIMIVVWVWFINVFNFMDGIDGIAGIECMSICFGVFAVLYFTDNISIEADFALIMALASGGFLIWNWRPAKIFLGDTGSIPLGFLLGWLLLHIIIIGEWEAAIILPMYYLGDAAITMLKRLFSGQRIWEAHRLHFYQRVAQNGTKHSTICFYILLLNICLTIIAIISTKVQPFICLSIATVFVTCFLFFLSHTSNKTIKY